jgi:biopolymer transport protein ExbB
MQRLFLSLLICLGFALPATAHAWWQDDWHYRKQIAWTPRRKARPSTTLGRTALLVRLHTGNFTFDGVKEDGATCALSPPMTRPCSITRSKASTR